MSTASIADLPDRIAQRHPACLYPATQSGRTREFFALKPIGGDGAGEPGVQNGGRRYRAGQPGSSFLKKRTSFLGLLLPYVAVPIVSLLIPDP